MNDFNKLTDKELDGGKKNTPSGKRRNALHKEIGRREVIAVKEKYAGIAAERGWKNYSVSEEDNRVVISRDEITDMLEEKL